MVHGCEMPDFMAIEWEQDWHLKIEDVRAKHGIEPFPELFPWICWSSLVKRRNCGLSFLFLSCGF